MKTAKLFILSLLFSAFAYGQENPNQGKIEAAMAQSFATQSNQIEPVINKLKQDESANLYWLAYAKFYAGIFHLHSGQKEKAEESVNAGIDLLQNIEDKSSEEHALLGYLLGFSISFDPSSAVQLSSKALAQYKAALKKDENNLRAYLGLGESDYYKPVEYGGGLKVEEYLLKAISLPAQSMENGPSWGKNTAFYTLASYYLREGQFDKAKMYCVQGLSQFPDDYQLNELKKKL